MADLARIKRNVAKMASMNAPETDIDNYIASEGVTIDDVRNFKPLELSDAQKQQIAANNAAYEQRQEENRPFLDKNPVGRLAVAGMQGIANAGLNPAGYVARAYGIDTKPFTPQNAAERGMELAGQYGYDAAALGGIGNIAKGAGYLGKGEKLGSKIAQSILAPESIATMAIAPAAGGGIAEGITNPTNEFERTVANIVGAMTPAAAQGAFAKTKQTLTTGLKGILGDNKANAAVSKGIRASENVAQKVADEAPAAYNELNSEMVNALDDATGRKLNIKGALDSQQQRYNDFIRDNADVELYSPKSAQEQSAENFKRWFDGSQVVDESGQPLKLYHGTDADFDAFDMSKGRSTMDIQGAFFSPYDLDARGYGSNLKEVYLNVKNPADEQTAYRALRKYQGQNDAGLKAKQDLQRQGFDGVFNGYDEYIAFEPNQIKSVNNSGAWSSSPSLSDAGWTPKASLKNFTQGLNEYQENALSQALNKGAMMSTNAKGSLGATHRAQEVLNDMIDASYDTSIIGQRKPTTETRQLMTVKDRLNQILEPSGVKPYDAGISKAKALQANYEKGYNFKPSEVKFENLGLNTNRDKRAFLQGYLDKIKDNTLSDGGTNLATAVKKGENALRKVLPERKFKALLDKANEAETNFKRLKSLENQANSRLVRDSQQGSSPWRENIESRGSIIGRGLDVLSGIVNRRGNTNLANQYLGNANQVITRGGLRGAFNNANAAGLRQLMIDVMNNGGE